MKFRRIFGNSNCSLWAVCYEEDRSGNRYLDVFRKLFNLWNNTQFLHNYFTSNQNILATKFWNYISVSDAIDKVLDESFDFETELKDIEINQTADKEKLLEEIFDFLHEDGYTLLPGYDKHKKGKPNTKPPMIRIYANLLEDGTYIVTGGGIKLTEKMDTTLQKEIDKIKLLQQFLKSEGIVDKEGLEDFRI